MRIPVIIDDRTNRSSPIPTVTVISPEEADPQSFDAVILSTDQFQDTFRQRLYKAWGNQSPQIVDLYENLPLGPYD